MVRVTRYRDLVIWKEAMDLCEEIYRTTSLFPKNEQYGLAAHMRKTVLSVPSNIAEGFVRKHGRECRQFLSISISSLAELDTQIILSRRLEYISEDACVLLLEKTDILGRRMTRFYQGIHL